MQILRFTIFILFSLPIFAFNGGPISEKVIKKAQRKYGGEVVKRYIKYNIMLKNSKFLDEETKLQVTNDFFNKVHFEKDIKNWKQDDYWATPLEFLARNKGDSEDYAIAKYFALITLGIDPKKLYFTYVNSKKFNRPHIILSYFRTLKSEPLILDNINKKILSSSKRDDLIPVYNFNPTLTKNNSEAKKQETTHKKWEKLYKRVKRNKL